MCSTQTIGALCFVWVLFIKIPKHVSVDLQMKGIMKTELETSAARRKWKATKTQGNFSFTKANNY